MQTQVETLKESNQFLNLLLDSIDAAILIVDEDLRIHQFNRSFLNLFDRALERVIDQSFGPVSGCVNAVRDGLDCGQTSQCQFCVLRSSLIKSFVNESPVERRRLNRSFYIDGTPVSKCIDFSAKPLNYRGRRMILVVIHDVTEIEARNRQLEETRAQLDHELTMAAEVQKSLLPAHDLQIDGLGLAWRFEPCGEIGGDIFQIHLIGKHLVSAYVLDVCGHGVSSALIAVSISQYLSSLHNRMRLSGNPFSPREVLQRLDGEFPMDRFDCFFSIVYARLDLHTGKLVYANAGHVPPLIVRAHGVLEILGDHGPVVGSGFEPEFSQQEHSLGKGDRLILYTDGLTENYGPDGERKGKERFHRTLSELARLPLADMVEEAFQIGTEMRDTDVPTDDMSLMGLEFTGTA